MKRLGKRLDSYENLARSSASERLDIMEMRRCNEAIEYYQEPDDTAGGQNKDCTAQC